MRGSFSAKQKVLVWGGAGVVLAGLLLGGSLFNWLHNQLELRRLTKQRNRLDAQYEELLATKQLLLDKDPLYMETLARVQYHMVKPGEIEYRFTNDD